MPIVPKEHPRARFFVQQNRHGSRISKKGSDFLRLGHFYSTFQQGIQVKFLFKKIWTKSKFKVCSRVQEPVLNMFKKIQKYLDIFTHCWTCLECSWTVHEHVQKIDRNWTKFGEMHLNNFWTKLEQNLNDSIWTEFEHDLNSPWSCSWMTWSLQDFCQQNRPYKL